MDRRDFLKVVAGTIGATALSACGLEKKDGNIEIKSLGNDAPEGESKMTMRINPKTGEKVSLLGYGCMRLPTKKNTSAREDAEAEIDQEEYNAHVDYAIAHGVNYFDTSPAYCQGRSEHHTGIALSRHPRDKYFIATKLSNFAPDTWSREAGIKMFQNSLKELQVDYIDYMLLHAIGGKAEGMDAWQTFEARYLKNGILDYLVEQREKGTIKNLGFSYHGDIKIYDYLLSQHDKYKWDFVQIQLNYVDWKHAKEVNERNTNAEYLYGELVKRGIPAVIMEPLLGGRLASTLNFMSAKMKAMRPEDSIASWAFRHCGSFDGVLTVLSGMTYMENLKKNVRTYSPLVPCNEEEMELLEEVAQAMLKYPSVPCTACQYCMPCKYGIDIPSIFRHYNNCINEGYVSVNSQDPHYAEARRAFLLGYDRKVSRLRQADHCIGCGKCVYSCPQGIDIPKELQRIDSIVEELKRSLS